MGIVDVVEQWAQERGHRVQSHPSAPKDPRVIILGENHQNFFQQRNQAELIERLGSDVLVHEFARNYVFDLVERKVRINQKFPTPQEALDFAKKDTVAPYGLLNGKSPFNIWMLGNDLDSYFSCSIGNYEASFLALSFYGNFGKFLESPPPRLKQIIGADISYAEQRKYEAENKASLAGEWGEDSRSHHVLREQRMADAISLAVDSTTKPIVVVLGNYHIMPEFHIHASLQKKRLEYLYADQDDATKRIMAGFSSLFHK